MSADQFTAWLEGFLDAHDGAPLVPADIAKIRQKMVEVKPIMPAPTHGIGIRAPVWGSGSDPFGGATIALNCNTADTVGKPMVSVTA